MPRCIATWVLGTAALLAGCTPAVAPGTDQTPGYNPPTPTPVGIRSPQEWVGCMGGDVARVRLDSNQDGSLLTTSFGVIRGVRWSVTKQFTQTDLRLVGWRGTSGGVVLQLAGGGTTIRYAVPTPPPPPPPPPTVPRIRATTEYGRDLAMMDWGLPTDYHHRTPSSVLQVPTAQLPARHVRAILPTKWELTVHFGLLHWQQLGSSETTTGSDYRLNLYPNSDTIEYSSVRRGDAYLGSVQDAKRLALAQIAKFGGLPRDATLTSEEAMGEIAVPLARPSKPVTVRPIRTGYMLTWEHTTGLADDQIRAIVGDTDGTPYVSFVTWRWNELDDVIVRLAPARKPLSALDAYSVSSCYGWSGIAADDRVDPLDSVTTSYWSDPGTNVAKPVYVFRYSRSGLARFVDVYTGAVVSTARLRPELGPIEDSGRRAYRRTTLHSKPSDHARPEDGR